MRWFILAMVVVSASAFFTPQSSGTTPNNNNNNANQRLPDMNIVMQLVRQILTLLIPKLLANPHLMASLAGNNGGAVTPPVQPRPQPQPQPPPQPMPPPVQPPPMPHPMPHPMPGGPPPPPPPYMGGGGMHHHHHDPYGPPLMGGGGMRPMGGIGAMGDKFKDMRIMELLNSPALNLRRDPMVGHYLPRHIPLGWSMPDQMKDPLIYSLRRKQVRGQLPPEGMELMQLVGDIPARY